MHLEPSTQHSSPAQNTHLKTRSWRRWLAWLVLGGTLMIGGGIFADWWHCLPDSAQATYVGRAACAECHAQEMQLFAGSDHDRAMAVATDKTVLGDFNNATLVHHGITSRMFRRDGKFMIHTEGPDGKMADFEIKYVFGVRPLQQYMVEFDRPKDMPANEIARLQVLRISWDTKRKKWFYMPPSDVPEKLDPHDPLHWTGIGQRWNDMCAYCHSTNLQKNYDVSTGIYHTTFSEIDVSCEACHGPGSIHVALARRHSLFWDRKRGYGIVSLAEPDSHIQIQACAPCHSRRADIYPNFRPGDNYYDYFSNELLRENTYFADGQIKDEDYVFGSFIQSKMYHNDIRCTDCHDPHAARLKHDGNKVCTSCHQHSGAKYDSEAHHHHKMGTLGASCPECHMPQTTYMEVDPRRDHSIRIPRPDLSVALGLPNACTRCHLSDAKIPAAQRAELKQYRDWIEAARNGDTLIRNELERLDQWSLDAVKKWYGDKKWPRHFAYALHAGRAGEPQAADELAKVAANRLWPGIVRATAIMQRGMLSTVGDLAPETRALHDPDPQVRQAAVARFFDYLPDVSSRPLAQRDLDALAERVSPITRRLVPMLRDPRRNVRVETGRVLARVPPGLLSQLLNGQQREEMDQAIQEYIAGINEANDRGGAHMVLGVLYESLGWDDRAIAAYRDAIRVEPDLTGPRSNLAALLERILRQETQRFGPNRLPKRVRGYAAEIKQLRRQELKLLARDARLLPNNAALQYRYGLAAYLAGQTDAAEKALRRACELEPNNDRFLFALAMFYEKYERRAEALSAAARLLKMQPTNPQYRQLYERIKAAQSPR